MVEVDVFWSYGFGASFALSAFRQLRQIQAEKEVIDTDFSLKDMLNIRKLVKEMEKGDSAVFDNPYFRKSLMYLALFFVPSGANLLWSNPNWETMQVGSYETIPGWLVSIFTITNVSQGIMGFWTTYNLLMRGKYYRAALQTTMAYFGFWFILVNGWDKTGYKRFFSKNKEAFENWQPSNVIGWLQGDVVRILGAYSFMIPLCMYWMMKWLHEGYKMEGLKAPESKAKRQQQQNQLTANLATSVFGVGFASAVVAHLLIRWFGWIMGGTTAAGVIYLGFLSKWGINPILIKRIMRVRSLEAPPVWELAAARKVTDEEKLSEVSA